MTTQLVGAAVARSEVRRLLRGAERFLDDLGHDAYEVAILRSPRAHARARHRRHRRTRVDGLIAIHTFEDLPPRRQQPMPLLTRIRR